MLLAIDPGSTESGWVYYHKGKVVAFGKEPNEDILEWMIRTPYTRGSLAVEMIASYGMAVGAEVFQTCVWVGRFTQRWRDHADPGRGGVREPRLVYRREVKLHLCGSPRAKDTNVRQAIIDRYGPGKDKAVGLKASPGPLYGFKADCWQALGLAITADETAGAA